MDMWGSLQLRPGSLRKAPERWYPGWDRKWWEKHVPQEVITGGGAGAVRHPWACVGVRSSLKELRSTDVIRKESWREGSPEAGDRWGVMGSSLEKEKGYIWNSKVLLLLQNILILFFPQKKWQVSQTLGLRFHNKIWDVLNFTDRTSKPRHQMEDWDRKIFLKDMNFSKSEKIFFCGQYSLGDCQLFFFVRCF